jgi:hypothetical protein
MALARAIGDLANLVGSHAGVWELCPTADAYANTAADRYCGRSACRGDTCH